MMLTADNDQRVAPAHAYKMAATMHATVPSAEVDVRTRRGAGHGGGNAYSQSIEYQADIVSFPVRQAWRNRVGITEDCNLQWVGWVGVPARDGSVTPVRVLITT